MNKIDKTNEEWKKELDSETFHVTREGGKRFCINSCSLELDKK